MTAAKSVSVVDADSSKLLVGGQLEIETRLLEDAPWNARKTFDRASLDELSASIKEHGIQVPLIVRQPNSAGYYQVVAGHRRLRAAEMIDLQTVPCIVRDLTEDQAREIGIVDNLQRENVPPMEEAVAFAELRDRLLSVEAVAARVQKDQAYVAQRLKLCSLSLAGQDALRHRLITVDHALVLARLGADEQDAALKWCLDHNAGVKTSVDTVIDNLVKQREEDGKGKDDRDSYRWRHTWEPQSVQRLKDHVASESGIVLDRAAFSLDDDTLAEAPACNQCPQNTKANAPLFGDLEIGEAKCTDTGCFKEKTQAFVNIALNRIAVVQDGRPALRVSWKATSIAPRMGTTPNPKYPDGPAYLDTVKLDQVFKAGQWELVKKKSCEHARAAVAVDWSDSTHRGRMENGEKLRMPGEVVQVCIEPKCKVHPKDYAKPKSASASSSGTANEKAAQAARELVEAERIAQSKIRLEIVSRALASVKSLPAAAIRRLALEALPQHDDGLRPYEALIPGIRKIIATAKADSAEFAKAVALSSIGTGELTVLRGWQAKETQKDFVAAVGRLGYDASKTGAKPAAKKAAKVAPKKAAKKAGKR